MWTVSDDVFPIKSDYGLDILINGEPDQHELAKLIQYLIQNHKSAVVRIWNSIVAYNDKYNDCLESESGYILFYVNKIK